MRQIIKVPLPSFGDGVRNILLAYGEEVAQALEKEAKKAAIQCRDEIQRTAPKDTGTYQKTWTVSRESQGMSGYNNRGERTVRQNPTYVVHAKHPGFQLAHLLERSHVVHNQYGYSWGRTAGHPHIEPAALKAGEQYLKNVKENIKELS